MRDAKQKDGIIHNQEVQALLDNGVHETTKVSQDLSIIPQAVIHMQVSIRVQALE